MDPFSKNGPAVPVLQPIKEEKNMQGILDSDINFGNMVSAKKRYKKLSKLLLRLTKVEVALHDYPELPPEYIAGVNAISLWLIENDNA